MFVTIDQQIIDIFALDSASFSKYGTRQHSQSYFLSLCDTEQFLIYKLSVFSLPPYTPILKKSLALKRPNLLNDVITICFFLFQV